jgi:hypothetical protein
MARMRLRKLGHFGMVKSRQVYTEASKVYLLGRPGYTYLVSRGLAGNLSFVQEIDLRVFEHDKAVTDLRLGLEAGVRGWKSERELRHERPWIRVPDAVFMLGNLSVALEFENTEKGADRYRGILLNHLERPAAGHVLYVLRTPERLKSLAQLLESLRTRRLGLDLGRVSFALEKEILDSKLEAPAVNLKRGRIKIAELSVH